MSQATDFRGAVLSVTMKDVFTYTAIAAFSLILLRRLLRRIRNVTLPPAGKAVLIAGCDTGFGRATAFRLAEAGYVVFAGCLDASQASAKTYSSVPNVHVVQLDIRDKKQIEATVQQVTDWLQQNPSYCLHAVHANAGVFNYGFLELLTMEAVDQIIDVNLVGAIRVVRSFLPVMRLRGNKTDGRIVMTCSTLAELVTPGFSPYCASKAAMMAFADSLRFEVERFGISVSLVCPDMYASEMTLNIERNYQALDKNIAETDPAIAKTYEGYREKSRGKLEWIASEAKKDISPVVNGMFDAITSRYPKRRYYPNSSMTRFMYMLNSISPLLLEWFFKMNNN